MGADIVEIDLALTSDSVLVVCHDRTIDRTTSGRGLIAEITYDSIRRVNLRAGQNAVTHWKVPTLEEALILCKDKIVVNIDKGFQYYGLIHPLLEKYGMLEQVLIKSNVTADRAAATFSKYDDNCLFMPIVNFGKKSYRKILESYERLKYPLLAYEICWSEYTPEVETCMREVIAGGSKLPVALPERRALRRCRGRGRPGRGVRETGRYGRHHDPDRPPRTADLLPPLARTARLTP